MTEMQDTALDTRFREVMASGEVWAGLDETVDKVAAPDLTDEGKAFVVSLYDGAVAKQRPEGDADGLLW